MMGGRDDLGPMHYRIWRPEMADLLTAAGAADSSGRHVQDNLVLACGRSQRQVQASWLGSWLGAAPPLGTAPTPAGRS
jgi:hypothetical protein